MKQYLLCLWIFSIATLGALAQVTEIHTFNNVNKSVPDGNPAGVADSRLVPSAITSITSVKVRLRVTGEFNGDLYGYVTHGSGLTVLLNRPGKTASNQSGYADSGLDVTFDDAAANGDIHLYRNVVTPTSGTPLTGAWQPDRRKVSPVTVTDASARTTTFGQFTGLGADGTWTLFLADMESGATNRLDSWEIEISGQATPTITWPAPAAVTYGTALGGTQLNASAGGVAGSFSYSPAAGTKLNAGNGQTLRVTFTPNDPASYAVVQKEVSIDVLKAPLTITAVNKSKTYGAANPALTASYTGFVNGDTAASLDTPVSLATTATAGSPAGSYPITASGAADVNYTITHVNGTLTINKAPLTITAANKSKTYGAPNPILTATYTGFVNGDTVASLDTPVSLTTTATTGSTVASYPITAAGAADVNYTITHVNGTLTVNKAPLTIAAENKSKTFGAVNPVLTVTYAGFVNGDTATSLDTPVTVTTTATTGSPVGVYPITPSQAADLNYSINFVAGELTISNAASSGSLSVSANPVEPGQPVTLTATLSAQPPATGTPTGTVQFRKDGSPFGAPVSLVNGIAQMTTTMTLGNHAITASYPGDGNFSGTTFGLAAQLVVNSVPDANEDSIDRVRSRGAKVSIATLLANDSDADGEAITFRGVSSTSPLGAIITVEGSWVVYRAPSTATGNDSFSYTIEDPVGNTATGTVLVNVLAGNAPTDNLSIANLGNGSFRVTVFGIPNDNYTLEYKNSLEAPLWDLLTPFATDGLGKFELLDTPPAGVSRFYRSVWVDPAP